MQITTEGFRNPAEPGQIDGLVRMNAAAADIEPELLVMLPSAAVGSCVFGTVAAVGKDGRR